METVNFQCGHCGKLMAVTTNMLGRQVRCPHCQQVVVAPLPRPTEPPPTLAELEPSEPESIFTPSEEEEEDLFGGSTQPRPELPPEPAWQPPTLELPSAPRPDQTEAYNPPRDQPSPFSSPRTPEPTTAVADANPWANNSIPTDVAPVNEAPDDSEMAALRGPSTRPIKKAPSWLLPVLIIPLISYSIVVTALLFFCYLQLQNERAADPMKRLLDEGYNPHATPAKPGMMRGPIPWGRTPYRPLPDSLKTTLGKPLTVNQLEVTPRKVELRKVLIFTNAATRPENSEDECVVLYLDLKNVSEDVDFYPLDPYFLREYKSNAQGALVPFTFLAVGDSQQYFGGPARFDHEYREHLAIENLDESLAPNPNQKLAQRVDKLLRPGEKMTTFVASPPLSAEKQKRVLSAKEPLVFRVRLRNGLQNLYDKGPLTTTAVIGVEFSKDEIVPVKTPE